MTYDTVRAGLTLMYGLPRDEPCVLMGNCGIFKMTLIWIMPKSTSTISMRPKKDGSFVVKCAACNIDARAMLKAWRQGG